MALKKYTMTEKMWLYPGETANWHFLTVPKKYGQEIKELYGKNRRGFGSIRAEVTIGKTTWKTSIFPDKHAGTYILPVKAAVRKAEDIYADEKVKFTIKVGI